MLWSEGRNTLKFKLGIGSTQGVSDGENTRIKYTDDISCVCLFHDLTVLSHQLLRLGQTNLLAALDMVHLHTRFKFTRNDTHKCNTVSVGFIHISLDLKYKSREIFLKWIDHTRSGLSWQRRGRHI